MSSLWSIINEIANAEKRGEMTHTNKLGIQLYDNEGKPRSLSSICKELSEKMQETEELVDD